MQRKDRTGETGTSQAGQTMTIIQYRNAQDIDVQFADGTIVTHRRYSHFKAGNIQNPNKKDAVGILAHAKQRKQAFTEQYIGQESVMNNGQTCKITEYQDSSNITVHFPETDTIVQTTLKSFQHKTVQNPDGPRTQIYRTQQTLLGETGTSKYGTKGCITNVTSRKDITVTFEDKSVLEHVTYQDFIKQRLITDVEKTQMSHVGETKQTKNGMSATLIAYHGTKDITVKFEDGTIIEHQTYHDLNRDKIAHPLYPTCNTSPYSKPTMIGHILRKKIAYKCNTPNYYCTCKTCLKSDIWDWKEIQTHNQLHEKERKANL